ncbi:MAG: hypothetical protein QG661_180 [Actinomycetota bacterium]|nr:hypothetical protein [Actinomycetota bacterium]
MDEEAARVPFRVDAQGGAGLTRSRARHPSFTMPSRGLRIPGDLPQTMGVRMQAVALLPRDGAVFCGASAATLLGLPIPIRLEDGPVWLMVPEGAPRARREGVRARQADIVPEERVEVEGLPCTSPARTFVDLAAHLSIADLAAVGDAAMRLWAVTPGELQRVIRRRLRYTGKVKARYVAPLLDAGAESPQESRLRMIMLGDGLPAPSVNLVIRDDAGQFLARCDLGYEEWRIAIEYDGEVHGLEEQRRYDATRRTLLRSHDWYVVEVIADDLRMPQRAIAKVRAALRSRRALT